MWVDHVLDLETLVCVAVSGWGVGGGDIVVGGGGAPTLVEAVGVDVDYYMTLYMVPQASDIDPRVLVVYLPAAFVGAAMVVWENHAVRRLGVSVVLVEADTIL